MIPVQDRRLTMTEAEFLALPESNDHLELVDGEVLVIPGPSLLHQLIVRGLLQALQRWCDEHPPSFALCAPLDVPFGPGRILQPDVMLWREALLDTSTPIGTPPTLVIEVLSKNGAFDRIAKRLLYAEGGVAEYWIVDPQARNVEVVRGLVTEQMVAGMLTSPELPSFHLDLSSIFRANNDRNTARRGAGEPRQ